MLFHLCTPKATTSFASSNIRALLYFTLSPRILSIRREPAGAIRRSRQQRALQQSVPLTLRASDHANPSFRRSNVTFQIGILVVRLRNLALSHRQCARFLSRSLGFQTCRLIVLLRNDVARAAYSLKAHWRGIVKLGKTIRPSQRCCRLFSNAP
jgi:hypothetical protein